MSGTIAGRSVTRVLWARCRGRHHSADCFGRLSQRMIAGVLQDLFHLTVSDGQFSRLQSIGRKALQTGYNDIVADVQNSAALNIDETGWREHGSKTWLWTVVGKLTTLFAVRPSRSRNEVHHLLGKGFSRIMMCDRYSAYNHPADESRQFCWAQCCETFRR
jgi:transposase